MLAAVNIHEVVLTILGGVGIAVALLLGRVLWTLGTAMFGIIHYVLPHFEPPTEQEIRSGVPDNTLPARTKRVEDGLALTGTQLATHMQVEEELRKADAEQRRERQRQMDELIASINPDHRR